MEAGNLAKAAQGNVTMQSQFSWQNKEFEAYFGVALTRRVGRGIVIIDQGSRLAFMIRRQFAERLPGGKFVDRWHVWLAKERLVPRVFARVSSFTELAKIAQVDHAAAVQPDVAEDDFDPKCYAHRLSLRYGAECWS